MLIISLVLLLPLCFLLTSCKKTEPEIFTHARVEFKQNGNDSKFYITVTDVDQGLTGLYNCVTFDLKFETILPYGDTYFLFEKRSFDFYFTEPQSIKDVYLYNTDTFNSDINSFKVAPNSSKTVHLRIIYNKLTNFSIENSQYVLLFNNIRI